MALQGLKYVCLYYMTSITEVVGVWNDSYKWSQVVETHIR